MGGRRWCACTELIVGSQDANVFFLVAKKDVDFLWMHGSAGLVAMCPEKGQGEPVLSTMSKSIADVRKACGGRSSGSICGGTGPLAPPRTLGPCCGGGVALYTPPYPRFKP